MTNPVPHPDTLQFADDASRELIASHGLVNYPDWFTDRRINVWRDIRERQNATLDLESGKRLHVKRLRPPTGPQVIAEVEGIRQLEAAGITTVPLVVWGVGSDGSGLLVMRDLEGHVPADQLLERGRAFESLLEPTAAVAGRLHAARLHHRDLYLCHFLVQGEQVRLIDAARVRPLPRLLWRRWIVKDLAQFRFSGREAGVDGVALDTWLAAWARHSGYPADRYEPAVKRKCARIARHDVRLRRNQPERRSRLDV